MNTEKFTHSTWIYTRLYRLQRIIVVTATPTATLALQSSPNSILTPNSTLTVINDLFFNDKHLYYHCLSSSSLSSSWCWWWLLFYMFSLWPNANFLPKAVAMQFSGLQWLENFRRNVKRVKWWEGERGRERECILSRHQPNAKDCNILGKFWKKCIWENRKPMNNGTASFTNWVFWQFSIHSLHSPPSVNREKKPMVST